jgi:hypothetical protein
MALIDSFRNLKKGYPITTECSNCLVVQDLNVPKGLTIEAFLERESAKCNYCGCSGTLKKIPTRRVEREAEKKQKVEVLFRKDVKSPFKK